MAYVSILFFKDHKCHDRLKHIAIQYQNSGLHRVDIGL